MKISLLIWFLFCNGFLYAQDKNQQSIEFQKSNGGEIYSIYLVYIKNTIKVTYKKVDSLSKKFYDDSDYKKFMDESDQFFKNDKKLDTYKLSKWNDDIEKLKKSYTFYTVDSITFRKKDYPKLNDLFYQMLTVPASEIENISKNKQRIVIDGYQMRLLLNNNGVERKIYATSPSLQSHPLITKLLTEVLQLYSEAKKHNFPK